MRVHPTYKSLNKLKLQLKQLSLKKKFSIEISYGNSLSYDLYRSDIHFTHQSAVLCEASELRLETICLSKVLELKRWIGAQLEENSVIIVKNEKEIIKEIIQKNLIFL